MLYIVLLVKAREYFWITIRYIFRKVIVPRLMYSMFSFSSPLPRKCNGITVYHLKVDFFIGFVKLKFWHWWFVKTPLHEIYGYTTNRANTFSLISKPDASILTPSIARQQVYPCWGSGLFSFAQESTHWGPAKIQMHIKLSRLSLKNSNFSIFVMSRSWIWSGDATETSKNTSVHKAQKRNYDVLVPQTD